MSGPAQTNSDSTRISTKRIDIHIHVPEGAIPKDGPSAGITMATALISALTRIPARHDVAMTGEVTLRGRVLPIGGLKEKVLAAHRGGIRTVLVPSENEKDILDIPANISRTVDLQLVDHMDQVLRKSLVLSDPDGFLRRVEVPEDEGTEDAFVETEAPSGVVKH